jgi:hypothetical protein
VGELSLQSLAVEAFGFESPEDFESLDFDSLEPSPDPFDSPDPSDEPPLAAAPFFFLP